MAIFILTYCFGYLGIVTILDLPESGNEHAKTIVPFILSIIGTIAGFYYGYSLGQKNKGNPEFPKMDEAVKTETDKLQAAQIESVKSTSN